MRDLHARRLQTLLTAGADIRIKNYYCDAPLKVAQKNEILKGTRDYCALGSGLITRIGQWPRERLQT